MLEGGGGLRYASNSETDRNMEAGQLESYLPLTILGFLALADYHHLQPPISLEKQQSLLVQCTCIQEYLLGHRFICPTYRTKSENFLNLQSLMKHDFCLKNVLRHFKDKNTSEML